MITIFSIITFFIDVEIFTEGYLGLAFFIVVMFAGSFPKQSTLSKRLRSVRKEYSIFGFITLLPHTILYGLMFIDGSYSIEWFGVISFLIMIPLFLMSFHFIKRKMKIKTWMNIQKLAYFVYLLIFIHLLLIGESDHIYIYIILFTTYSFLKCYNFLFENQKLLKTVFVSLIIVISSLYSSGSIDSLSLEYNTLDVPSSTNSETLADGVYLGQADGFQHLPVSVEVTIKDGLITNIEIIEYGSTGENRGINYYDAAEKIALDIINNQTTDVDTISGATYTTSGIIDAVEDALNN
jgi:DMSO/TMAO reductase YedYZ heme-binding membrane subunit/uncharacterized protein with FMN-binding domain